MPAIAASVAFQITLAGGIGSIITGALTSLASSLILSGLQKLIAPKPPKPRGGSSAIQNSGITQQVKASDHGFASLFTEKCGVPVVFFSSPYRITINTFT
jgi:predicted phage tail protein